MHIFHTMWRSVQITLSCPNVWVDLKKAFVSNHVTCPEFYRNKRHFLYHSKLYFMSLILQPVGANCKERSIIYKCAKINRPSRYFMYQFIELYLMVLNTRKYKNNTEPRTTIRRRTTETGFVSSVNHWGIVLREYFLRCAIRNNTNPQKRNWLKTSRLSLTLSHVSINRMKQILKYVICRIWNKMSYTNRNPASHIPSRTVILVVKTLRRLYSKETVLLAFALKKVYLFYVLYRLSCCDKVFSTTP